MDFLRGSTRTTASLSACRALEQQLTEGEEYFVRATAANDLTCLIAGEIKTRNAWQCPCEIAEEIQTR